MNKKIVGIIVIVVIALVAYYLYSQPPAEVVEEELLPEAEELTEEELKLLGIEDIFEENNVSLNPSNEELKETSKAAFEKTKTDLLELKNSLTGKKGKELIEFYSLLVEEFEVRKAILLQAEDDEKVIEKDPCAVLESKQTVLTLVTQLVNTLSSKEQKRTYLQENFPETETLYLEELGQSKEFASANLQELNASYKELEELCE